MALAHVNKLLLAILVISQNMCFAAADVPQVKDDGENFFTLSFGNLPEELREASDDGKQGLLLFFESDYCPYCHYMRANVFNQKSVQDWFGVRYTSVAIDLHGDIELTDFDGATLPAKDFCAQQGIYFTPVISFFDSNGREVYRHNGMVETPEEFLLLGEYVAGHFYQDTGYKAFVNAHGLSESDDSLVTPIADDEAP